MAVGFALCKGDDGWAEGMKRYENGKDLAVKEKDNYDI